MWLLPPSISGRTNNEQGKGDATCVELRLSLRIPCPVATSGLATAAKLAQLEVMAQNWRPRPTLGVTAVRDWRWLHVAAGICLERNPGALSVHSDRRARPYAAAFDRTRSQEGLCLMRWDEVLRHHPDAAGVAFPFSSGGFKDFFRVTPPRGAEEDESEMRDGTSVVVAPTHTGGLMMR
ncbi:hypothetical protein BDP81DRAFT_433805 [Colletotrichum phormii]|uniref:Uncharacterized protein n=1 Tax=Colletotrichum phormii TaxID=359342 RepID=A0AAI9ZLG6_9PEZI|nr:uncharacterized protein BDP81DRAFT_433805 [Colletotrichum phormii]KAK1634167.1 hypothetical protein BDP81DRAFT_433805 [Colletotrichum phormii]